MPGEFLTIMGASGKYREFVDFYIGAGKTTLLNYLSGRQISKGLIKLGNIIINGKNRDKIKGASALSAYV